MPPSSSIVRTQIPNLPAVIALAGDEQFEIVQAGVSYKCTLNQLRALFGGGGSAAPVPGTWVAIGDPIVVAGDVLSEITNFDNDTYDAYNVSILNLLPVDGGQNFAAQTTPDHGATWVDGSGSGLYAGTQYDFNTGSDFPSLFLGAALSAYQITLSGSSFDGLLGGGSLGAFCNVTIYQAGIANESLKIETALTYEDYTTSPFFGRVVGTFSNGYDPGTGTVITGIRFFFDGGSAYSAVMYVSGRLKQ
jgi:hypothetical protein